MDQKLPEQLCRNAIFDGLTQEQIQSILPCIVTDVEEYGAQECLVEKGQEVENLGVVLAGGLLLCAGEGVAVDAIGENGLLGEADVFSSTGAAPYRIVSRTDSRVVFLSREFFTRPCSKDCASKEAHRKVMDNLLRLLSDKTASLTRKIAYLSAPDLKTKIAMYLWELYETTGSATFTMPLNRDKLADYFAVARPSLSRELGELKAMGIVDYHRSSVEIKDARALRELAFGGKAE